MLLHNDAKYSNYDDLVRVPFSTNNKPGTAQVGAISKAQKDSKTTFSTTGDNKSSQKTKN